jgi:hypothetical protein
MTTTLIIKITTTVNKAVTSTCTYAIISTAITKSSTTTIIETITTTIVIITIQEFGTHSVYRYLVFQQCFRETRYFTTWEYPNFRGRETKYELQHMLLREISVQWWM